MLVLLDRRCFVRSRRRFCCSVLAAVAALFVGFPPGLAFPQGTRGGTITFALYQEPELLNRYIGTQTALSEVTTFIVEGLVDYNEKGEFFPRLATEIPTRQNGGVSADGKSITYTSARASNGRTANR